jgi:putative membrane protein (TIGR04086 family)
MEDRMDKAVHRGSKATVIIKDLLISYIVTGILLLILAFLMYKLDVSSMILNAGIILTYILSNFIGGFLLGKSAEQKRFLWGLVMGAIYFAVLIITTMLTDTIVGIDMSETISVLVICLFSGMFGAMLS